MSGVTAVVMARAPREGKVKTRLRPLLGAHGRARLQTVLLRHVCGVVRDAGVRLIVAVDPPDALAEVTDVVPPDTRLTPQVRGDLGERMRHAAAAEFARGASAVVILGVDLPTLTPHALRVAVDQLANADVVIGPACDGGYYLLASRRPVDALFALRPSLWGGPNVLAETLTIADRRGLSVALMPVMRDLDTPDDAAALLVDPLLPTEIAEALRGAGVAS